MKTKYNFQGHIGSSVDFNYSAVNGRYYEKDTEEPLFSLIDVSEEYFKEKEILPVITVKEAFDVEDCPY